MNNTKQIFDVLVVCALSVEAKPIIKQYELQHVFSEHGFKLYGPRQKKQEKSEQTYSVGMLVTGVGKLNMAMALMWSQQLSRASSFLNVGIAGHGSADIDEALLINKVIDDSTQTSSFPTINFPWKRGVTQLKTVDMPSSEYAKGYAYDMEASAFFYAASKFVSNDKTQSLKIVSDNVEHSYELLSGKSIAEKISSIFAQIDELVSILVDSKNGMQGLTSDDFLLMQARWHITLQQEIQLKSLYVSALVIQENTGKAAPQWQSFSTAKDYIYSINKWLNNVSPKLVL